MPVLSQDPAGWLGALLAGGLCCSIASLWVGAAAAGGFCGAEGSSAHFPAGSPLLRPQMLFVRQHRGNPHGAAYQGFSPTRWETQAVLSHSIWFGCCHCEERKVCLTAEESIFKIQGNLLPYDEAASFMKSAKKF